MSIAYTILNFVYTIIPYTTCWLHFEGLHYYTDNSPLKRKDETMYIRYYVPQFLQMAWFFSGMKWNIQPLKENKVVPGRKKKVDSSCSQNKHLLGN